MYVIKQNAAAPPATKQVNIRASSITKLVT